MHQLIHLSSNILGLDLCMHLEAHVFLVVHRAHGICNTVVVLSVRKLGTLSKLQQIRSSSPCEGMLQNLLSFKDGVPRCTHICAVCFVRSDPALIARGYVGPSGRA